MSCKTQKPVLLSAFGILYIFFGILNFLLLRISSYDWLGLEWYYTLLPLLLGVWVSDIGGYVAGKSFGKVTPFPNISPNKTWAGFYGAIFSPAVLFLFGAFAAVTFDEVFTPIIFPVALVLGVLIGILGQVGDLLVSAIKRMANVKDMGILIPGHGGLLDRVDSLLLVTLLYPAILMGFLWVIG